MLMRLDKLLAEAGQGTRSEIRDAVRKGCVTVDGEMVRDPGAKVDPESHIALRGVPVRAIAPGCYILYYKGQGTLTATEDRCQTTVLDDLRSRNADRPDPIPLPRDLFPVGRLDKDTEGLLLITDDGDLAHRLLSPRKHVPKCYEALLDGPADPSMIEAMAAGLPVDEGFTAAPAKLEILPEAEGGPERVRLTITEGKFHQIKRMFHALGREVIHLKRLTMGPLTLDPGMASGDFRLLTEDEIRALKDR